jgi:hypothetical protein
MVTDTDPWVASVDAVPEYWLWHSFRGPFLRWLIAEGDAAEQVGLVRPYICCLSIFMRLT